jgi:hypothetical protein
LGVIPNNWEYGLKAKSAKETTLENATDNNKKIGKKL